MKLTVVIIIVLLLCIGLALADDGAKYSCGEYEISITGRNEDDYTFSKLRVLKKGQEVFMAEDFDFFSSWSDEFPEGPASICQDITGDGIPDATIFSYSGGAHCCWSATIFSLGDEFKVVDTLATEHGGGRFEDINGDGVPEFLAIDWSFAYWYSSFANSPAPQIVLRFKDGKYVLDPELMKRAISEIKIYSANEELNRAECESGNAWNQNGYCLTADIWGRMLDFIYAGHEQEAWEYLDSVWGSDQMTKELFVADFKQQLAQSAYAGKF